MKPTIVLLVALLAGIPPALADPPVGIEVGIEPEPRGSVIIHGDAGFTADAGVRSGNGTAESPYIISDWLILPDAPDGIRVTGTRAHVVIENVRVASAGPGRASIVNGTLLHDVQNVVLRNVSIDRATFGMQIVGSSDILVERAILVPFREESRGFTDGIDIARSQRVTLRSSVVRDATWALVLDTVSELVVEQNTIASVPVHPTPLQFFGPLTDATFRSNRIERGGFGLFSGAFQNITVHGNDFIGGYTALSAIEGPLDGLDFCGNLVTGMGPYYETLSVLRQSNVRVRANVFHDNMYGALIELSTGTLIENNVFRDHALIGLNLGDQDAIVRGNSFEGNRVAAILKAPMDARHNWWGAADGPSGDLAGSGDRIELVHTDAIVHPWLDQAPPSPDACSAGPHGAEGEARIHLGARASLQVTDHEPLSARRRVTIP